MKMFMLGQMQLLHSVLMKALIITLLQMHHLYLLLVGIGLLGVQELELHMQQQNLR